MVNTSQYLKNYEIPNFFMSIWKLLLAESISDIKQIPLLSITAETSPEGLKSKLDTQFSIWKINQELEKSVTSFCVTLRMPFRFFQQFHTIVTFLSRIPDTKQMESHLPCTRNCTKNTSSWIISHVSVTSL
mgnify:FL=1